MSYLKNDSLKETKVLEKKTRLEKPILLAQKIPLETEEDISIERTTLIEQANGISIERTTLIEQANGISLQRTTLVEQAKGISLEKCIQFKDRIFAYIRISLIEENSQQQREAISQYLANIKTNVFEIYEEKTSGKNLSRPILEGLKNQLTEGDTLIIESYARLSRSLKDLFELLEFFDEKKVTIISLKENFNSQTINGKATIDIFRILSDFEREILKERQQIGIELAKKAGKYKGRKRIIKPLNFELCLEKYKNSNRFDPYTLNDFKRETGLTTNVLYRLLEEHNYSFKRSENIILQ